MGNAGDGGIVVVHPSGNDLCPHSGGHVHHINPQVNPALRRPCVQRVIEGDYPGRAVEKPIFRRPPPTVSGTGHGVPADVAILQAVLFHQLIHFPFDTDHVGETAGRGVFFDVVKQRINGGHRGCQHDQRKLLLGAA